MESVLIEGYYGENNLGDDFILYSILSSINKSKIKDVTVVTCGKDNYTNLQKKFKRLNINIICKNDLSRKEYLLLWTQFDYVIIGGGGLFPSESIKLSIKYFLRMILAKIKKKRIIMYGVEFNSFQRLLFRRIWNINFSMCDFVSVRNDTNAKAINEIGYKNVISSSDVTFSLTTEAEEKDSSLFCNSLIESGNEYIVWAIGMPWLKREFENPEISEKILARYHKLCALLSETINSYPQFTHILLPFYDKMDFQIIRDIDKMVNVSRICCDDRHPIDIDEKRLVFRHARAAVCMRFHSVLFALYSETPFCAVSYSPKTSSVLKENDLEENMVLFGVRDSQFFYKEFDIDEVKFKNLVEKAITDGEKNENISLKLKKLAVNAEEYLLKWLP